MKLHSPEEVGMSSERLGRIDSAVAQFVKNDQIPGIMTLLQRRGKVVHLSKHGLMDIEAGRAIEEDALFRIYSMTKPIVSVALMMLYEEGRLSLTDPVSKYIPAFGNSKVYAGSAPLGPKLVDQDPAMNIYHLLTHTAGLSYGWFFDSPIEDQYRLVVPQIFKRHQSLEEVVDRIAELPLLFQPGTQWRYSYATDVVGRLVEIISGMPLADFLETRVFMPLEMVDTSFHVPAEKLDRLAQLYVSQALYNPIVPPAEEVALIGQVTTPTNCPSAGGGLISTLADYLKFCNCLIQEGRYAGGRLLSRKTLAWMTTNHLPQHFMPLAIGDHQMDLGFGLGFAVAPALGQARSLTSAGVYGWGGAAKTLFWIDPAEDFIGIIMTQYMPMEPYPFQERIQILAYQAIDD